jgi:hypothetical protein
VPAGRVVVALIWGNSVHHIARDIDVFESNRSAFEESIKEFSSAKRRSHASVLTTVGG